MTFSIIIPIYNSAFYVKKCIDSIKSQSFSDFEVILINDGSTDNSLDIINQEIKDDSRFYVYTKTNSGVSATRNIGLSKAKGDYIIFIDSDDWIEPTLLQEIYEHGNNSDIIQYDFYETKISKKKEIHIKSKLPEIVQGEGAVVWKRAFKRELLNNILFDESLIGGEDYLFCVQAFLKMKTFCYINKCLYNYNISNQNSAMHKNFISNLQAQLQATQLVSKILIKNNLYEQYKKDLDKRYFWCLAIFNNWWLSKKIQNSFLKKVFLKIIKIILF